MCSSTARGESASRTSTPARRKPVAVSGSVITANLYNDHLLPHPVARDAELLAAGDEAQVLHFIVLEREVGHHDVDAQRVTKVETRLRLDDRQVEIAFERGQVVADRLHREIL